MAFFLGIMLVTALLALPFGKMPFASRERTMYLVLVAVVLSLAMGLRDISVGTDTINYSGAFNEIARSAFMDFISSRYEPLFYSINWLISLFAEDVRPLLFVESAVTIGLMVRFIGKNSYSPLASVLLFQEAYFYCSAFNVSRAWLAFSIALIGYEYARDKRLVPALGFVLVGSLIHTSSLLFTFAYLLVVCREKISDASVIIIGGIALFTSLFARQLAEVVVQFLPRYEYYLTNSGGETGGTLFPMFLIVLALAGLILIQRSDQSEDLSEFRVLALLLLLGASCLLMVHSFPVAVRLAPMFTVFILLFVPMASRCSEYGWILVIGSVGLMLVYYLTLLRSGIAGVIPYETWLFALY